MNPVLAERLKAAEDNRAYYAKHKDAINAQKKKRRLERLYGITHKQFDELFLSQGKACAVCESNVHGGRGWHVDHCHSSGVVRGILCHHCNVMLGHAKDSPDILAKAIRYLEANK